LEERRSAKMIQVNVEIPEHALTSAAMPRERITAPSIEWALRVTCDGKSDRKVRLLFPVVTGPFFVPESFGRREAA
jgi:hypothetical protein